MSEEGSPSQPPARGDGLGHGATPDEARSLRVAQRARSAAPSHTRQGGATVEPSASVASCVRLWGLPAGVTSQQLLQEAAAFGHALSASVASDDGASSGTGLCMFASWEAAQAAAAAWQRACPFGPDVLAAVAPPPQQQPLQHTTQQQPTRISGAGAASTPRRKTAPKPAVVVRGLSPDTTTERLAELFSAAGPIKRLRLVADEAGGSAGVAFVTFLCPEGMRAALALGEGLQVDGCQPTVAPAHRDAAPAEHQQQRGAGPSEPRAQLPQHQLGAALARSWPSPQLPGQRGATRPAIEAAGQPRAPPSAGHAPPAPPASPAEVSTDTLFARPLGLGVDEAALQQLFGPQAGVVSVRVLRHPDGTSKACGFVRFADHARAQLALQAMDGAALMGRPVRLTWALHRQPPGGQTPVFGARADGAELTAGAGAMPARYDARQVPRASFGEAASPVAVVPMVAAAPGYAPAMMVPFFYHPGAGMYAAAPSMAGAMAAGRAPALGPYQLGGYPLPAASALPAAQALRSPSWEEGQQQWAARWQAQQQQAPAARHGGAWMPRPRPSAAPPHQQQQPAGQSSHTAAHPWPSPTHASKQHPTQPQGEHYRQQPTAGMRPGEQHQQRLAEAAESSSGTPRHVAPAPNAGDAAGAGASPSVAAPPADPPPSGAAEQGAAVAPWSAAAAGYCDSSAAATPGAAVPAAASPPELSAAASGDDAAAGASAAAADGLQRLRLA